MSDDRTPPTRRDQARDATRREVPSDATRPAGTRIEAPRAQPDPPPADEAPEPVADDVADLDPQEEVAPTETPGPALEDIRDDSGDDGEDDEATPWAGRVPHHLLMQFDVQGLLSDRGSEADVWSVTDRHSGAPRALKVYRPSIEPDSDALRSLRALGNEPEGAPHVVRLYATDQTEGRWYEVQELCSGGSLRELLDTGQPPDVHDVAQQMGAALAVLEERGIILRDFKPDNVMVRSSGTGGLDLAVGDYGLACLMGDASRAAGRFEGTIPYVPPEFTRMLMTRSWDWWSFGMVLAEVALGRHPLSLDAAGKEMPVETDLLAMIANHPVDVSGVADERVNNLCRGLLVRDYRIRWQSPQVLAWLAGGDPEVPVDPDGVLLPPRPKVGATTTKVQFGGNEYDSAENLAVAFQNRWSYTVDRLFHADPALRDEHLVQEIEAFLRDRQLLPAVRDLRRGVGSAEPSLALAELLLDMSPKFEPKFEGIDLSPIGLRDAARAVLDDSGNPDHLDAVDRTNVLTLWRAVPGVADADTVGRPWREGSQQIDYLIGQSQRRGADLGEGDEAVARLKSKAKAYLLLCELDPDDAIQGGYRGDLLRQVHQGLETDAKDQSWWRMLADDAETSLPSAALAAVTRTMASVTAREARSEARQADRARRERNRERRDAERARRRDRVQSRGAGGNRGGVRRSDRTMAGRLTRLPGLVACVLIGWHLWLLAEYGGAIRDVVTAEIAAGHPDRDLQLLDRLVADSGWLGGLAIVFLVACAVRPMLRRPVQAELRTRIIDVGTLVIQLAVIVGALYSGLIGLLLGHAARNAERVGVDAGALPPWAELMVVAYAVMAFAAVMGFGWTLVRMRSAFAGD